MCLCVCVCLCFCVFFCVCLFLFLCLFLFFLLSCDKGSDLIIEETSSPETTDIFLLNNLDPGFVFPENLQYMASRGVNSSVCIDIPETLYSPYGGGSAPMQGAGARSSSVALDRPLQAHTCNSSPRGGDSQPFFQRMSGSLGAVSYTHLTLPTSG